MRHGVDCKKDVIDSINNDIFLLEVEKTTSKGIINIPSDEEVYT